MGRYIPDEMISALGPAVIGNVATSTSNEFKKCPLCGGTIQKDLIDVDGQGYELCEGCAEEYHNSQDAIWKLQHNDN